MGYQESFVTCSDFDWLLDKVNQLGKRWFDEREVEIAEVVILNEDLHFNLEEMCHSEVQKYYPQGTQFLWIVGHRGCQRQIDGYNGLLDKVPYGKEVNLYFIECLAEHLFKGGKWNFCCEHFTYDK